MLGNKFEKTLERLSRRVSNKARAYICISAIFTGDIVIDFSPSSRRALRRFQGALPWIKKVTRRALVASNSPCKWGEIRVVTFHPYTLAERIERSLGLGV